MYSQIFIARNETFPSLPSSVSSHQATATTSRILGSLSLHPCDCANVTHGGSTRSLTISWGRVVSLPSAGGVDPTYPKEARIHMPGSESSPEYFRGLCLLHFWRAPSRHGLKIRKMQKENGWERGSHAAALNSQ